ncbi:MAG TPA: hypothetical protein VKY65_06465 [Alphaproteobacteria bacterium]|nr:hypothetical protein [Alphaproteobacteria bacterium]
MKVSAFKIGLLLAVLGITGTAVHAFVHGAVIDPDALLIGIIPALIGLALMLAALIHYTGR